MRASQQQQQQQALPQSFELLPTQHGDVILDVRYNHYGNKLATCSADQMIKVWELHPSGEWRQTAEWKAHDASIWKLAFAPPEFGDILASCSYDRTVIVWERSTVKSGPKGLARWINRAKLVDSRQSVTDIQFSPKHLGLKLATCSQDGSVRIYEAVDVMNLMHWPLVDEFEVAKDHSQGGASCVAWCPSQFSSPALAVGAGRRVQIWRNDGRKWTETSVGGDAAHSALLDAPVNAVAWAPNLGRSYELIATAAQDRTVRIFKVFTSGGSDVIEQNACWKEHKSEVWHVEFNCTGTVLASSGDDGTVRLWTRDAFSNEWRALTTFSE